MYTNATPQADGRARRPWRFLKPLMFGGIGVLALLAGGDTAGAASVKARVKAGVLTVTGTGAAEEITLRVSPTNSNFVEVDLGDDGSAQFRFARATFSSINVYGAGGADTLRIDDSNDAFTNT